MYCLQDYEAYSLAVTDEMSRELVITYETIDNLPLDNLTFKFPLTQSIFNTKRREGNSFVKEINRDLIYPYLDGYRAQMTVEIEQGVIERNEDWTGIGSLFGSIE